MERGFLVGHFELQEKLGAGGMGVVFRARDQILHRDVALKVVHPDRGEPDFHRRFLDEARIAATLTHPGIAAIYEPERPGSPPVTRRSSMSRRNSSRARRWPSCSRAGRCRWIGPSN